MTADNQLFQTRHPISVIFHVAIIVSYIAIAYMLLSNELSASGMTDLVIASAILLVLSFVGFLWDRLSNREDKRLISIAFVLMIACMSLVVVVGYIVYPSQDYYDECTVLTAEYKSTLVYDCIDYAESNSDATGSQIIEALTEQNRKILPIEELFDRPLNP